MNLKNLQYLSKLECLLESKLSDSYRASLFLTEIEKALEIDTSLAAQVCADYQQSRFAAYALRGDDFIRKICPSDLMFQISECPSST
jgi:hypothetical protein